MTEPYRPPIEALHKEYSLALDFNVLLLDMCEWVKHLEREKDQHIQQIDNLLVERTELLTALEELEL